MSQARHASLWGICLFIVAVVWEMWTFFALGDARSSAPDPWAKPVLLIVAVLGVKGAIAIPLALGCVGLYAVCSPRR
jgi:hypothetical protein